MEYHFNAEVAAAYGVEEAIFLHNLYWWVRKNESNGRHYYDGRSWTYNSMKALASLLPFWSEKQIRRIITRLKDAGLILVANYNETAYDRTQWYAISDDVYQLYNTPEKVKSICPNGQIEVTKRANRSDQMGEPIPDSKPYSKPNTSSSAKKSAEKEQKKQYERDSQPYQIACHLRDKILENKPDHKPIGEPTLQSWAHSARLMIERDKRSPERILSVIDYSQSDEFWRANILSVPKLRDKFDALELRMGAANPPKKGRWESLD